MIATEYRLERFVPEAAKQQTFEAVNRFLNAVRRDTRPDDPPMTLEATVRQAQSWQHLKDSDVHFWALWRESEIVAYLLTAITSREDNRHLLNVTLHVLEPYRRQGLATKLLAKLLELAEAHGRSSLIGETLAHLPAGAALAERLGARRGLEAHTNQLELSDLDPTLLDEWLRQAPTNGYALEFLAGPYPEEELEAVCELLNAMNTAPRDELEVEDFQVTPERVRQWEAYHRAQGLERWTLLVRQRRSEALVGVTIVYFDPSLPEVLRQDDTVVVPEHRGQRLGKWLKAAMLEKVLRERPAIRRVRTGNADSNAPMLAINHTLGFKPYLAETVWQLDVARLAAYLQGRGLR